MVSHVLSIVTNLLSVAFQSVAETALGKQQQQQQQQQRGVHESAAALMSHPAHLMCDGMHLRHPCCVPDQRGADVPSAGLAARGQC